MNGFGSRLAVFVGGFVVASSCGIAPGQTILFQDDFDSGTMSPEWVSMHESQWIQDGWMHTRSLIWWPRNSQALVHDSDTTWTDYDLHITAEPVQAGPWQRCDVLFRTDGLDMSSDGIYGTGYRLILVGEGHDQDPNAISLWHMEHGIGSYMSIVPHTMTGPVDLLIRLRGPRIEVIADGTPIIDVVDPSPFLYGGIGVHNTWEMEGRYDNVLVRLGATGCNPADLAEPFGVLGGEDITAFIDAFTSLDPRADRRWMTGCSCSPTSWRSSRRLWRAAREPLSCGWPRVVAALAFAPRPGRVA
jgi:hypothetical protein